MAGVQHHADGDHGFIAAHRAGQHRGHAAVAFPRRRQRRRPDHRARVQQRPAVDIVHFQHIAQIGYSFQHVRPGAACRRCDRGLPCTRNTGEPIEQVQTRALPLAFEDGPR